VTRALLLLLLALLLAGRAFSSSTDEEIKKKQTQLQKLRKDIDTYEDRIKEREKREHSTLELLDAYDKQAVLLRRLIGRLHDEETALQRGINDSRESISQLTGQISFLRKHYAHYVATVYQYGHTYDLELLLSSRSFNQVLIRAEYLKRFSDQRRRDLDKIDSHRLELEKKTELLSHQLAEQHDLLTDKQREEQKLSQKMARRKALLTDIRRDKKNFKKELGRKMQAVKDLQQLIAKLIEEDRVRKERERKTSREPSKEVAGVFESRRGRLRWPVAQGKLAARFGSQEHPTLHTITQNTGIDIAVPSGTEVVAVADGEVSLINFLPSFGNLIILNHNNGYRTVYAHLSDISISEGEKVGEGQQIGRSGESLTGPLLHFEIYKDREKQDPEHWLRPRGVTQR